jgi:glutamine synthetase
LVTNINVTQLLRVSRPTGLKLPLVMFVMLNVSIAFRRRASGARLWLLLKKNENITSAAAFQLRVFANRSDHAEFPAARIKKGAAASARIEVRSPDPSCNPYLAFAALIMAGLDGMGRQLSPPGPVEDDIYRKGFEDIKGMGISVLPYSLMDALKDLSRSDLVRRTLGEHLFREYQAAKWKEWDDFRIAVTDWEKRNYL